MAPQVEAVVRCSASIWVLILSLIAFSWAFQCSLESNCSPRMRTTGSSSTTTPCSLTGACRSMRLRLVRWVRVYLLGANRIPCVLAQFKHCSCAISRLAQFPAAVLPYRVIIYKIAKTLRYYKKFKILKS